jgi:hypothetical protein
MGNLNDQEAFAALLGGLNKAIADQFKTLIEQKHVYQKVALEHEPVYAAVTEKLSSAYKWEFKARLETLPRGIALVSKMPPFAEMMLGKSALVLIPTNVKLFCNKCSRSEAFAPVWYKDVTGDLRQKSEPLRMPPELQFFCFAFQCQSCAGVPELQSFLIRYEDFQMSVHGRSPIEHIELPPYIPKAERDWFRDALIALHGGKTLAALFYLRTFIEQFARRQTGLTGKKTGDEIMTAYAETLPQAQRSSMPSLREWYDKLSEAIHDAKEDSELFEKARTEIEHHFDIRRVFKIPDAPPAKQKQTAGSD